MKARDVIVLIIIIIFVLLGIVAFVAFKLRHLMMVEKTVHVEEGGGGE